MTSSSDGLALQIEGWLAEQVAALDLDRRTGPGKPRVLPALLLWTGLVVCVLRGMSSQAALWRLLAQRGLWSFPRIPISDDAVRVRLARDGTGPMERLFAQVTTLLAARITPFVETKLAAFASDVLVLDEITLDKVARLLPAFTSRATPSMPWSGWGKHRADRAKHAVRLIQFVVNGRTYRSITNVLDPAQLSMREAAQLYARRWDIEMAIAIVKTELGLHLVWAAKPVVIQQQIWAVLIIHQIFAAFRLEIAGRAEVDLFDVSLPLLIEYFPHYARAGTDPIALFVECGRELGFIRPSSRHGSTTSSRKSSRPSISPSVRGPVTHSVLPVKMHRMLSTPFNSWARKWKANPFLYEQVTR